MRLSDFKQAWSLYKLHEMSERHSDQTDVSFKGHRVGTIRYEDYTTPGFPIKEIPLLIVESESYSEFIAGSFTDSGIFSNIKTIPKVGLDIAAACGMFIQTK